MGANNNQHMLNQQEEMQFNSISDIQDTLAQLYRTSAGQADSGRIQLEMNQNAKGLGLLQQDNQKVNSLSHQKMETFLGQNYRADN